MKYLLITIGLLLICFPKSEETEEGLIKEIWGEINEYAATHRGKNGLILVRFKADHSFDAYETTCTGDNVLQRGEWKVEDDVITLSKIRTEKFRNDSKRKGKILSKKDSGKIEYKIKEMDEHSLVLENANESTILRFETTSLNYFPKE